VFTKFINMMKLCKIEYNLTSLDTTFKWQKKWGHVRKYNCLREYKNKYNKKTKKIVTCWSDVKWHVELIMSQHHHDLNISNIVFLPINIYPLVAIGKIVTIGLIIEVC